MQRLEMENATRKIANIDLFDTDRIWQWFLRCLTEICSSHQPDAIVTTTHGASAILLGQDGKLLDLLDYESGQYQTISTEYDKLRDGYYLTGSPNLTNGLNLGRQIYWVQKQHPHIFEEVISILLYPQYWTFLLTGVKVTEVTSLGTHTDLWRPKTREFSHLGSQWQHLFPPFMDAWQTVAQPLPKICKQTGLNPDCKILCGIHDSNATFAYHFQSDEPMTLLSTGTWVIGMCSGDVPVDLKEENDELLNVDLLGNPVNSFRFMGGREWQLLAYGGYDKGGQDKEETNREEPDQDQLASLIAILIDNNMMALPSFSDQGGPFRSRVGKLVGRCESPDLRKALASLYCAQVSAWCLARFSTSGRIIIDGPFIRDKIFLSVLSQLLPQHQLFTSRVTDGTSLGAARLAIWPESFYPEYTQVKATEYPGLWQYHQRWLAGLDA